MTESADYVAPWSGIRTTVGLPTGDGRKHVTNGDRCWCDPAVFPEGEPGEDAQSVTFPPSEEGRTDG